MLLLSFLGAFEGTGTPGSLRLWSKCEWPFQEGTEGLGKRIVMCPPLPPLPQLEPGGQLGLPPLTKSKVPTGGCTWRSILPSPAPKA